ncbi:MAG TPA: cyclic nucleotide-binding domain-containing protein [Acidimicrobiales bacterium]|nr:cyclic nucleotide-binding domain-containing protein [Acidimicrobiales bacterium]
MKTDLAELVARHPLFAGLPADLTAELAGCARNVAFPAEGLLQVEGEAADTLFLVRRGRVAIEVHAPGRGPLVIETVGPGGVVGWSWLIPPYRCQFDARATEPVGAISVDVSCLRTKSEADPAFGYALLQRVSAMVVERLQKTRIRLLDLYASPETR